MGDSVLPMVQPSVAEPRTTFVPHADSFPRYERDTLFDIAYHRRKLQQYQQRERATPI